MKLLKQYFDIQQQIHDFFGYKEDWAVIPLDDCTEYHWYIDQAENGSGSVYYAEQPLTPELIREGNKLYHNIIYTQRFLPKWVYRADGYTMICVDTQTDGNKFLSIFDNSKELTGPTEEQVQAFNRWKDMWGG